MRGISDALQRRFDLRRIELATCAIARNWQRKVLHADPSRRRSDCLRVPTTRRDVDECLESATPQFQHYPVPRLNGATIRRGAVNRKVIGQPREVFTSRLWLRGGGRTGV